MKMWNVMMGVVLSLALLSVVGPREIAAQTDIDSRNADHVSGKLIFDRHCAGCHGPKGKGDGFMMLGPDPANLTRPSTTQKSDMALLKTIHEGKFTMPAWKLRLSEEDSRAVLAYIRTLTK
ncbi:MAG: putative Cytochrome c55x [Candidatus Nitrospira kreftii]|uniref:Putative Cytochrome c55x n=1 Tax=Candidatus Nitrospira kreftii TaxID=2652173 RepID=A0A7S8FCZ4_9BACT|nr:MAG: putative Cytochrome c55x [Candidatus Nitrospira kreftii]